MKLFTSIAAAAVIGASFAALNPVKAGNGWIYSHDSNELGGSIYYKPLGCSGDICKAKINFPNSGLKAWAVNCRTWQADGAYGWQDLMPGSHGEHWAKNMCK